MQDPPSRRLTLGLVMTITEEEWWPTYVRMFKFAENHIKNI